MAYFMLGADGHKINIAEVERSNFLCKNVQPANRPVLLVIQNFKTDI